MRNTLSLLLGGAALALVQAPTADAQTAITTTRIISGAAAPVWVGPAPGDDERLFVVEQNTRLIRIWKNGAFNATPFLNVSTLALSGGERGLLGLAFHPEYESNGYFFINYTANPGGATHVARVKVSANPDVADFSSLKVILTIPQPFANHNGGNVVFGPDGYLYIGTGDGGSGNDPACRAQNPAVLLGKMLRIDVDTIDTTGTYGIPASNPFVGLATHQPEIWALGLRNPWRFSFDSLTGALYIGDVGQDAREEIDYQPPGAAGLNYGWKVVEGNVCGSTTNCAAGTPPCGSPIYTPPIHTYNHGVGGICSVTGGVVYRGCAIPDLQGTYFFADYCSGAIWSFRYDGTTMTEFQNRTAQLAPGGGLSIGTITHFGVDQDGEILIVDSGGGEVFKIVPSSVPPVDCPPLRANFNVMTVSEGGTQKLRLDAGAAHGNEVYWLLGSSSGTTPGVVVDGVALPLNLDAYMEFSLSFANIPPFVQTLGFLDAQGQATMAFSLPPGSLAPSLIGLELHHAAVVITPSVTVDFASNPVPLTFIP